LKKIRKRLTYANVMSSIAVFLLLGGATAFAAKKISSNQIKAGAVKTGKLAKEAVKAGKLAKNAVTTPKISNDAVTGDKVNEASLGTVPSATSATSATNATNVAGQTPFLFKLSAGQTQQIATHGSVSLLAQCQTGVGGNDRVRILAATSQDGALLVGDTAHLGPGVTSDFLNVGTPEDERVLMSFQDTIGDVGAAFYIDRGWVMGPDGKMLGLNAEGTSLALNYAGAKCIAGGIVFASG
jgi:hypothetical protein